MPHLPERADVEATARELRLSGTPAGTQGAELLLQLLGVAEQVDEYRWRLLEMNGGSIPTARDTLDRFALWIHHSRENPVGGSG